MFNLGNLLYTLTLNDKEFNEQLKNNEKEINSMAEKATKAGKALTLGLTLPLTGLGVAAVKVAADFEVLSRKFNTAFKGVDTAAKKSLKSLNEQFGLSGVQATKLLANTGDLLKGFGATSKQALDTSTKVQELAASLSAYNNIPVEETSEKITKALLGETEGLKSLGVAISAVAVEEELKARGQEKLTGTALNLAKAEIVLKLATEQSSDAISSFSSNTDTLNFLTGNLAGQAQDLAASFGEVLLPVVKSIVQGTTDLLKYFTDLGPATKATIVGIAGIAALAGPIALAFGKMTAANLAFIKSLLLNPFTAVAVGVAAAAVAIGSYIDSVNKARQAEREAQEQREANIKSLTNLLAEGSALNKLATESGPVGLLARQAQTLKVSTEQANDALRAQQKLLASIEITRINSKIAENVNVRNIKAAEDRLVVERATVRELETQAQTLARSGQAASANFRNLQRQLGIAREEVTNSENILKNSQQRLSNDREYNALLRKRQEMLDVISGKAEEDARKELERLEAEKIAKERAEEAARIAKERAEKLKKLDEERIEIINRYNKELELSKALLNNNLITNEENLENEVKANEKLITSLIEKGFQVEQGNRFSSIGNEQLTKAIDLLKAQKTELKKINDEKTKAKETEEAENKEIEKRKGEIESLYKDLETYSSDFLGSSVKQFEQRTDRITELLNQESSFLIEKYGYTQEEIEKLRATIAENGAKKRKELIRNEIAEVSKLISSSVGNLQTFAGAFPEIGKNIVESETNELIEALDKETEALLNARNEQLLGEQAYEAKVAELRDKYRGAELRKQLALLDKSKIAKDAYSAEEARILEEQKNKEDEINKDAANKRFKIEEQAFGWMMALNLAQATAQGANAVLNAYTAGAAFGPVVATANAVIAGLAAAAQIAIIASTPKPTPPRLAEGGIVNPTMSGRQVVIGEAGSPEAVIPLNDAFFNRLAEAAQGRYEGTVTDSSTSNEMQGLSIYLDGERITEAVVRRVNNRQYTINAASVR